MAVVSTSQPRITFWVLQVASPLVIFLPEAGSCRCGVSFALKGQITLLSRAQEVPLGVNVTALASLDCSEEVVHIDIPVSCGVFAKRLSSVTGGGCCGSHE